MNMWGVTALLHGRQNMKSTKKGNNRAAQLLTGTVTGLHNGC